MADSVEINKNVDHNINNQSYIVLIIDYIYIYFISYWIIREYF